MPVLSVYFPEVAQRYERLAEHVADPEAWESLGLLETEAEKDEEGSDQEYLDHDVVLHDAIQQSEAPESTLEQASAAGRD